MSRIRTTVTVDAGLLAQSHWQNTNDEGEHFICFNSWGNSLWIKADNVEQLRAAAHELNRLANVLADRSLQGVTGHG